MMLSLAARRRTPELMDAPDLDIRAHRHALRSLGRANAVSRTTATLWAAIGAVATGMAGAPLRVLDLACGGGHVAIGLARRAKRTGVNIEIEACDLSPVAIDYARQVALRAGVAGIRFRQLDALRDPLPANADVVLCSLFLHHLSDVEAVALLGRMRVAARKLVLVSDLRRSTLGYLFSVVGCRLLSASRVFHVDGVRSVEGAFTTPEAQALADCAGLAGASLSDRWPQRFLLSWRPAADVAGDS